MHAHATRGVSHDARKRHHSHTCPGGWNISRWTCNAAHVLRHAGYHVGRSEIGAVKIIAARESGNDPGAVNNWDSNAAAGTPSEGLMQTIAPTFHTYKLRGHGNMLNPVSDIIAAFRYAVDRYGSVNNVPGVKAVRAGGAYVGY
ncbi:MAG: transglycosylase SLT domain-containing protein [Actinobacteria bacterium]|nr:transglycosylase SLT domain-containing protein [Actinomycetota bacterium]